MFGENYPAAQCGNTLDSPTGNVSLEMRLNAQIQQADQRAADLKRAKEILEKNPELKELLDIMRRVGF